MEGSAPPCEKAVPSDESIHSMLDRRTVLADIIPDPRHEPALHSVFPAVGFMKYSGRNAFSRITTVVARAVELSL